MQEERIEDDPNHAPASSSSHWSGTIGQGSECESVSREEDLMRSQKARGAGEYKSYEDGGVVLMVTPSKTIWEVGRVYDCDEYEDAFLKTLPR